MAEKFNNYLVSVELSSSNRTVTIVPKQGAELPDAGQTVTSAAGLRTSGSTCQVHSIYLTKSDQASWSQDPENDGVLVSIGVCDNTNNNEYFIAKCIKVLPNSSFYIEKTITLRPQDSIRLTYEGPGTAHINTVCSAVDLT